MAVENTTGKPCFFCYKNIDGPTVCWFQIANSQIDENGIKLYLHPKCAVMLGERIVGDGFEANLEVENVKWVHTQIDTRISYARSQLLEKYIYTLIKNSDGGLTKQEIVAKVKANKPNLYVALEFSDNVESVLQFMQEDNKINAPAKRYVIKKK